MVDLWKRKRQRSLLVPLVIAGAGVWGAEPLHREIDRLIEREAGARRLSPGADDAELLRRLYLDLAGRIPSSSEAHAFAGEAAPDKRERLIDRLLFSPEHALRMAELFHTLLMERRGDHDGWFAYLVRSFAENKPWDQMAREIIRPDTGDPSARDAAFFYTKRLEHYGENPIDYPGLVRDVGRLFLGVDLRCAQCHDHLFVDDYKQADFHGLFSVYRNLEIKDGAGFPAVAERLVTQPLEFASVFDKRPRRIGPRIPGGAEIEIPVVAGDGSTPSSSMLARFATEITARGNVLFARSIVNRLWFTMMGRGLVEPLDLHHKDNPPSHPELLDLLAARFVASGCDIRDFVRELALSATYQRSSLRPGDEALAERLYLTALERHLAAEQLYRSVIAATGEMDWNGALVQRQGDRRDALLERFVKALAGRPGEPELDVRSSLEGALFWRNDTELLALLERRPGNLVDRLAGMTDDGSVADELYWSVLTRPPADEERAEVSRHLARHVDAREPALGRLIWALLASAEFPVNH